SNDNSQRASSRKNRVYTFYSFISQTYPNATNILDAAGGRGDLSFLLNNIDNANSIIADPRVPNYTRIIKSVHFLAQNPEEVKIRSINGLPTYQPLAALMPLFMKGQMCTNVDTVGSIAFSIPKNIRMHVDHDFVDAVRNAITMCNGDRLLNHDLVSWDGYWLEEQKKIASNNTYYGGTEPKQSIDNNDMTSQIQESRVALEAFMSLDLIVGFHPDQATEAAIDIAIYLQIPFAVVPCCVFPSEFSNRMHDGVHVKSYDQFLAYLSKKHINIRQSELPFTGSDTAKSIVLYMLEEDFREDESNKDTPALLCI
ncbi:hypothetical protein ACHAXN_007923, partial [Cyclotella atomus]